MYGRIVDWVWLEVGCEFGSEDLGEFGGFMHGWFV